MRRETDESRESLPMSWVRDSSTFANRLFALCVFANHIESIFHVRKKKAHSAR
jgi:hypothetical protein